MQVKSQTFFKIMSNINNYYQIEYFILSKKKLFFKHLTLIEKFIPLIYVGTRYYAKILLIAQFENFLIKILYSLE